eukprot:1152879-Pelagomonas_calceolata.AAC.1
MLPNRSRAHVPRAEYTENVRSVQRRQNSSAGNALLRDGSSGAINVHAATASVYAPAVYLSIPNASVDPPSTNVTRTGPLAVNPDRLQDIDVVASQRTLEAPLPFLRTSIQQCVNLEMCLFPHLFPHGTHSPFTPCQSNVQGSYDGRDDGNKYHLHNYWAYHVLALGIPDPAVPHDGHQVKLPSIRKFTEASEDKVYESVAKCKVPGDFAGLPTWYWSALKDLQCMVESYGTPDLFLTLTADEVSPTRFFEISNMENVFLKQWFYPGTPHLYTVRAALILDPDLDAEGNPLPGLLGKLNHYVRRYECQNRGGRSMHILCFGSSLKAGLLLSMKSQLPFQAL